MEQLKEQFSFIYEEHVTRIYRFIYIKVSSQETAEDLCSEVFLRFWKELQRSQIENVPSFLYGVARNVVADHYRERKTQTVSIEEVPEPVSQESLQEQALLNSELEQVQKVLVSLNDDYQNLIIWRYLDELSVPEIAQITGKSEENVRVGIHRATKALRERLVPSVINEGDFTT